MGTMKKNGLGGKSCGRSLSWKIVKREGENHCRRTANRNREPAESWTEGKGRNS